MPDMAPRARIAIVDDEEPVRRALRRMLSTSLYTVDDFASGQEFLDSLRTRQPDCVLLDVQMPGLSGREVYERMRLALIDIPVVLMSAQEPPVAQAQRMTEGPFECLRKPLQRERLLSVLRDATQARPVTSHPASDPT